MSEPSVVLHIFGRMQRGGAENRTLALMRRIDRTRWQFHFGTLSGLPGELDTEIQALGGRVHPIPLGVGFPTAFRRVLREARVRIVHSHVHYSSGFILKLARFGGVGHRLAHFRSTHDGRRDTARRRLQRRVLKRWIDDEATKILAVGAGVMEEAWSPSYRTDPRCRVVYNGIDLAPFDAPRDPVGVRAEFGLDAAAPLLCHVGSFREAKNHRRLVSIFARLREQLPEARLLLVGRDDNSTAGEVRQSAGRLGVTESIAFAGDRGDVPRLLLASDAMVYPSVREGLPGAVLEACAAGLPVLASDLPGVLEIAKYLPLVRTASLAASDDDWAREAAGLLARRTTAGAASGSPFERFRGTPFDLDAAARTMERIYADG